MERLLSDIDSLLKSDDLSLPIGARLKAQVDSNASRPMCHHRLDQKMSVKGLTPFTETYLTKPDNRLPATPEEYRANLLRRHIFNPQARFFAPSAMATGGQVELTAVNYV